MLEGSSRWGKEIWVAAVGSVKTACCFSLQVARLSLLFPTSYYHRLGQRAFAELWGIAGAISPWHVLSGVGSGSSLRRRRLSWRRQPLRGHSLVLVP